jgi:hypothetical protein
VALLVFAVFFLLAAVGLVIASRATRSTPGTTNVAGRGSRLAITDNLVLRDIQSAMNEAFAGYDPLGIDQNGLSTNQPLTAAPESSLSSQVQAQMVAEIGQWIDVQTVSIPLLNFDSATQDKTNQLQQQALPAGFSCFSGSSATVAVGGK